MELVDRILGLFKEPDPKPLPDPDAKLALAALMVRVAKADKQYALEEITRIDKLLAEIFSLNPVEAAMMRADSEKLDAAAQQEDAFARLIRDSLNEQERMKALNALHSVMLADGMEHPQEASILRETARVLGFDESIVDRLGAAE